MRLDRSPGFFHSVPFLFVLLSFGAMLVAPGCGGKDGTSPPPSITGGVAGAPGGKESSSSPSLDPAKAIIGTWIIDNEAMKKRIHTDAKYANLDDVTKTQLIEIVGQMQGTCVLDGSKISINMSVPGQESAPPQVGKYRILNIDGKKLQIIMTDEVGSDDRADAVLDGDRLFITFDGETMEFTRKK